MQWTTEQWQQLVSHVAYNRELGIEFAELVPTGVVLRLRYRSDLASGPDGDTLHGGAIAAMVDGGIPLMLEVRRYVDAVRGGL